MQSWQNIQLIQIYSTNNNTYNPNNSWYCEIFSAFGEEGVTFQLPENEYLRKTYSENCK